MASQNRAFIIPPSFLKPSRKKLGHAATTVCWFTQQWQGKKVPAGVEHTKHARFTSCEGTETSSSQKLRFFTETWLMGLLHLEKAGLKL